MTGGPSPNLAASVHARPLNQARAGGRSFNDLLQLYAMERFLYRLSESRHVDADHFQALFAAKPESSPR